MTKQKDYDFLKIRIEKSKIAQIKSIAEMQNIEFDESVRQIIDSGIMFKQSNFLLSQREMNIRVLDNMLSQIYPMLGLKNHPQYGLEISVFEKICTFHAVMTGYFVQNSKNDFNEIIAKQAHEIILYVSTNFKYDFRLIKRALINMPRTVLIKGIYKVNGKKQNLHLLDNSNTIIEGVKGKLKNGVHTYGGK